LISRKALKKDFAPRNYLASHIKFVELRWFYFVLKNSQKVARFEFFTAVKMQVHIFWVVTPYDRT